MATHQLILTTVCHSTSSQRTKLNFSRPYQVLDHASIVSGLDKLLPGFLWLGAPAFYTVYKPKTCMFNLYLITNYETGTLEVLPALDYHVCLHVVTRQYV